MIALIVGGDLFGLLGIILAIPAAASAKVLFDYLRCFVESSKDMSEGEDPSVASSHCS